jgi:hypothetical protein
MFEYSHYRHYYKYMKYIITIILYFVLAKIIADIRYKIEHKDDAGLMRAEHPELFR